MLSVGTHFIFPNSIFKNNPSTIQWKWICLIVHTGSLPVKPWNFICKFGINIWSTVAKELKSMAQGAKKSHIVLIRNLLIEEELKPHLLFSLFSSQGTKARSQFTRWVLCNYALSCFLVLIHFHNFNNLIKHYSHLAFLSVPRCHCTLQKDLLEFPVYN